MNSPTFREKQREVENSGEGKHTIKPLPKNGFGPPPTYDTFFPPPPVCFRPVVSLQETGADQAKPTF